MPSISQAKKRKCFSLETKARLIDEVRRGQKSKAQICRENDIAPGTLYTILKDQDSTMAAMTSGNFQPDRKRKRTTEMDDLDRALLIWFKQARSQNLPVSGPILQTKGEEIAKQLGLAEDYKMSGGWLDRFKLRHGIAMKSICGESASAPVEKSDNWKENELKSILKDYTPDNIFNVDETGLYYKCLPNKTLSAKGDTCSGQKVPKDRFTVLVGANMDGSCKLPLFIIGKHEKPRCFKNIRTLPVKYAWNKKAWMTGAIFEEWLRRLDRRFLMEGRSVALLLDNCSAHPRLPDLRAIQLFFLPPNTTSILQPCDQGIIQNFKALYRRRVLKRCIASFDETGSSTSHFKMSLLEGLNMARAAWEEVESKTIANCFRKAGFIHEEEQSTAPAEIGIPETTAKEIDNLFEKFTSTLPVETSLTAYLEIDSDAQTSEMLTMEQIVSGLQAEEDQEEDDDDDTEAEAVSSKSVQKALETLRLYLQQQENTTAAQSQLNILEGCVQETILKSKKQRTIDSFFKPVAM